MAGLSGLDRYLEPPSCRVEEVEIDAECDACGEELTVDAVQDGDEQHWTCPLCGAKNTEYWDDDPVKGRGWF